MPQKASASKRLRQNLKRRARNRWRKSQIKETIKQFDTALQEGGKKKNKKKINEIISLCFSKLDKAASKGAIHKKTASRKKARLAAKLNAAVGAKK